MKRPKVARNKCSNLDSAIPTSLAICRRTVFVCSLILLNIGILSSLFLSKTDEGISSGFAITSSVHGSASTIFCSHGQCNSTSVSVSLFPRSRALNINRLEVIQIFAVLLSSSVSQLRFSVLLIVLPPDCDSSMAILFAPFVASTAF